MYRPKTDARWDPNVTADKAMAMVKIVLPSPSITWQTGQSRSWNWLVTYISEPVPMGMRGVQPRREYIQLPACLRMLVPTRYSPLQKRQVASVKRCPT